MSLVFKAGAGLLAGAMAGVLGFCFWPRVEPSVLATHPAVAKPVFVLASAAPNATPETPVAPPPVPAPAPTVARDKLAAALKSSPITASSAPSSTQRPSEEAARFFANGLVVLASGDIASARMFFMRAADAGDSRALMALGDTYDDSTLSRLGAMGMHGDQNRARDFYAQALAKGIGAAKERIAALEARGN